MNISIYGKYKVTVNKKYSYISDYDYDYKNYILSEGKDYYRRTMQGGALIDFIADLLRHPDCSEVYDKDNNIYISLFDPSHGTGSDYKITYKEVNNNASKKG